MALPGAQPRALEPRGAPVHPALGPREAELAQVLLAAAVAARRVRPRALEQAVRGQVQVWRTPYRPWHAQRWLHRSSARFMVLVCGRQSGKSHAGAKECVQTALANPGCYVAVLAPDYTRCEAAITKCRELAEPFGAKWKSRAPRIKFPNGSVIRFFSADRKESVRGPSIKLLWMDEAALLSVRARDAALGALGATEGARVLVTTTPVGKNWVFEWWSRRVAKFAELTESFRFRSSDSPYYQRELVEAIRSAMLPEIARQEFDAEFVDNLLLVFPPEVRERLFVAKFPAHKKKARTWVGIDLAKRSDWTVLVGMDENGEARVLRRWQKFPSWTPVYKEIAELLKAMGAVAVIDTGGPGGAPGSVLADYLRDEHGLEVVEVNTNVTGTKAKVVEQAKLDTEFGVVHVLRDGELADQLDYEMSKFQGVKRVVRGVEVNLYEGPQVPGEFDDCVVAFCLANWGRVHGEAAPRDPCDGDYTGFEAGTELETGGTKGPAGEFGDWAPLGRALSVAGRSFPPGGVHALVEPDVVGGRAGAAPAARPHRVRAGYVGDDHPRWRPGGPPGQLRLGVPRRHAA